MFYDDEMERLLKRHSEMNEAMGILLQMYYIKYSRLSILTNIPVIVISAISGFLSTINMMGDQNIMIGSLSLLVAIIKSLDNYFDLTKRAENHRLTGLSYMKISKILETQLALKRNDRIDCKDLLTMITNETQTLRESEPIIDRDIVSTFNNKYKEDKTSKPPITNGLTDVAIHKIETKDATNQIITEPIEVVIQQPKWKP